jgi:tocopherol O-methyltransferase
MVSLSAPTCCKVYSSFCPAYYLPKWVAGSEYTRLLTQQGLVDVRMDDWSEFVKPFWPAVIRTALYPWNIVRLIRGGTLMMKAAYASVRVRSINDGMCDVNIFL